MSSDILQPYSAQWRHDAILIQTASDHYVRLLELTGAHHQQYVAAHRMDSLCCYGRQQRERHPFWDKIVLVRAVLKHGLHQHIIWLDADTLIVDPSQDLRHALPEEKWCGMVRHGNPSYYNAGALYLRNTPDCVAFFEEVWSTWPVNHPWEDNEAIIRVIGRSPERWAGVVTLDNRWNCTPGLNDSVSPVVQGWHGCGLVPQRYVAMDQALKNLQVRSAKLDVATYLDALAPERHTVGYGTLGAGGQLGYEGRMVRVQGQAFTHALSAHGPSHVWFNLDARYKQFQCLVAFDDSSSGHSSQAEFLVYADGYLKACIAQVRVGDKPIPLIVDTDGVRMLELVVRTRTWAHCHTVWLEPRILTSGDSGQELFPLTDCLARAEIQRPLQPLRTRRCIATVVSPGYDRLLDNMLGSLFANGNCEDALVVVFAVEPDEGCARVLAKYGVVEIKAKPIARRNQTLKSILYSVAHIVEADQYLCLDADTLILGNIDPIFSALETCPPVSILACPDAYIASTSLGHSLCNFYAGSVSDLALLLGKVEDEGAYGLVVNDGVFAGSREAMLAIDSTIRRMMPQSVAWVDRYANHAARNQFVFNLALARLKCGIPLDETYNFQAHVHQIDPHESGAYLKVLCGERAVKIVHFVGWSRQRYPEWQQLYTRVPDPLIEAVRDDTSEELLKSLRAWIGRQGLNVLPSAFTRSSDQPHSTIVSSLFSLIALMYSLLRTHHCEQIMELGTAQGLWTACLATAVAHYPQGRVLTFDSNTDLRRKILWDSLPQTTQSQIDSKQSYSPESQPSAAIHASFDALLINVELTLSWIGPEFEHVVQWVRPQGLILLLVSDAVREEIVPALHKIEATGYRMVTLWTQENGGQEGNILNLVLVRQSADKMT